MECPLPGCGGVLGANTSLKTVHQDIYNCSLCSAAHEPTLDEMVDVTFTISPRLNIASRVQNLAIDRSIYATEPVVENAASTALLAKHGLKPSYQHQALKGVTERVKIYEIP